MKNILPNLSLLKKIILLTPFIFLTYSCGIGMPIMTAKQKQVLDDLKTLKEENAEIKETLSGNASEVRATMEADLRAMREEFSFVTGEAEESKKILEELRTTTEDLEARLIAVETKLKEITEASETEASTSKEEMEKLMADVAELKETSVKVNDRLIVLEKNKSSSKETTKKDSEKKNPTQVYNNAFAHINKKEHKTAIKKMRAFVKEYPKHSLADDALYWIGRVYYADGEFEKAILEFDILKKDYPKGDKAPAALLEQGHAFEKLGDKATASLVYKTVMATYPDSSEAKKAQKKLDELK